MQRRVEEDVAEGLVRDDPPVRRVARDNDRQGPVHHVRAVEVREVAFVAERSERGFQAVPDLGVVVARLEVDQQHQRLPPPRVEDADAVDRPRLRRDLVGGWHEVWHRVLLIEDLH